MGQVNKRVFNPMEIRRGKRPTITHTGRTSGRTYVTPLDAHRVADGFVFIVMYGSQSDWVKNVLAAGGAKLRIGDEEHTIANPRLIDSDAAVAALGKSKDPSAILRKKAEYLRVDIGTD